MVDTSDAGIASGKTTRRFRKVEGLLSWWSTVRATGAAEELPELHITLTDRAQRLIPTDIRHQVAASTPTRRSPHERRRR